MDLTAQLLTAHNRKNCDIIREWIGNDQKKFNKLLQIFLADDYRLTQLAAWPLCEAAIRHPAFPEDHFYEILRSLYRDKVHPGVKRNVMRLFWKTDIPEDIEGAIMDLSFNYILDAGERVAVKACALGILEKLAKKYPDIIPELKIVITEQMPHHTAAFKSRGRKILKKFK